LKEVPQGLEEFDIEFVKLKDGFHEFNYRLGKSFFEAFEQEEVLDADVDVNVDLEKTAGMMILEIVIQGTVTETCDRCLTGIKIPIDSEYRLIYKTGVEGVKKEESELDSELIVISQSEFKINPAPYICETVILSLPMIKNCDDLEEKPCDKAMLSKLENLAIDDEESNDPRWEKLKELLNKEKDK